MLDAGTGRTRARGAARLRATPRCARAVCERRSAVAPCPPGWTGPFVINILLLETQIKNRRRPPAGHDALKLKVTSCVRGVISPLLSNLYLNEVDKMLERAKETTRNGQYTYIEYARYADDLVVLIDAYKRHD